jgi:hypothetical protein
LFRGEGEAISEPARDVVGEGAASEGLPQDDDGGILHPLATAGEEAGGPVDVGIGTEVSGLANDDDDDADEEEETGDGAAIMAAAGGLG